MRVFFIIILITSCSCFFDSKDVDPFYTSKSYIGFPRLPLVKPIFMCYNKSYSNWSYKIPHSFKYRMQPSDPKKIGVDKTFIYGKLLGGEETIDKYENGDYVYLGKYGGISISKEISKFREDIRIYPIDSITKVFMIPDRWYITNVKDKSTKVFLKQEEYHEYLEKEGVSGKIYDANKSHKQYKETGILPWFPDSIKVKLRK